MTRLTNVRMKVMCDQFHIIQVSDTTATMRVYDKSMSDADVTRYASMFLDWPMVKVDFGTRTETAAYYLITNTTEYL